MGAVILKDATTIGDFGSVRLSDYRYNPGPKSVQISATIPGGTNTGGCVVEVYGYDDEGDGVASATLSQWAYLGVVRLGDMSSSGWPETAAASIGAHYDHIGARVTDITGTVTGITAVLGV